jgi:hypothetical protein
LNPSNLVFRWIDVWFCLVFAYADGAGQFHEPVGFRSVAFANVLVIGRPRYGFMLEDASESYDRGS